MTTVLDVVHGVRRHLLGGARETRNKLAASVSDSAETFTFTYALGGITGGSRLSVDLEDVHVWQTSSNAATVQRGDFGSTAAAHTAGAIVSVNPQYSQAEIVRAVNGELSSLSSPSVGLFQVLTADLTFQAAVQGYDLSGVTDLLSVWRVEYAEPGVADVWPEITDYKIVRNAAVGDFASTLGLVVYDGAYPGREMRVRYRAPFSAVAALDDDLADTGLPDTAVDVVEMGAALRLSAARPIRRSQISSQGDTRRAEEVSTSDTLSAPSRLQQQYQFRISQEAARLKAAYPQ